MPIHADQRYIQGLLENDTRVIREIYRRFSGKIRIHITQNSGTDADAADIFQESLMDVYHQARYKQLQLTCPFEPFFLLVCKRKWLNELKKRSHTPVTNHDGDLSGIGEDVFASAEKLVEEEEKVRMVFSRFGQLGEKCQEILRRSIRGEAQEKIAEKMGVSYGYLRKKKSECMATLLEYIHG